MTRIIIVHGFNSTPTRHFYPWLRRELEALGHGVIVPTLPHPLEPDRSEWLEALKRHVGMVDENTLFVTHSLGTLATIEYLASRPAGERCMGIVAVAPYVIDEHSSLFRTFFTVPVDFAKVRERIGRFFVVCDPSDMFLSMHHSEMLRSSFDAAVHASTNRNHYQDIDGVHEAPEVLAAVLGMLTPQDV